MKRIILSGLLAVLLQYGLFAGGQAESGRGQAMDSINAGQFLPAGAVDPENYLEDFAFEKTNTSRMPLEFHAELLRDSIWEKGEDISLRISLVSNDESFFKPVAGMYILYFQNPELLHKRTITHYLGNELFGYTQIKFFFFNPVNGKLLRVKNPGDIAPVIRELTGQKKEYSHNVLLQRLLAAIEAGQKNERTHVLWITDEDIVKKSSDAHFFNFAISVLSSGNTTFSYLGYGEVPNWPVINSGLMRHNGNTFYAKNEKEICEKMTSDISSFLKPAVENIRINIVWSQYVSELASFYPEEYYSGISGFYSSVKNHRPRTSHSLGGLNYGKSKRFIHYLKVPPRRLLEEKGINENPVKENRFTIGTVYVRFYVPMWDREYFLQKDLTIEYRDSDQVTEKHNRYVLADTIIQNTPLLLQEIISLVNRNRNYLTAIQLVKKQKSLLKSISSVRKDEAIGEDIEILEKCYELLFSQAKAINMIE